LAFSVGSLSASVTADQSGFNAAMNDVRKKGTSVASQVSKKFNEVGDSFISAGKSLTTKLTLPLAALAGASVKAFDTQIKAEMRLAAALRAGGEEVQNNLASFKEFATNLQEITTVGDESTLGMLQVAKSMGLTNEQAKRAAKNSIALSKSMGMSEKSAIRYTAALESGESTMLARYIPALRQIDDKSKRAAKAQELLAKMFSAATTEAEVGLGPLTQMWNTLGDFSEQIGEIVLKRMQPFIDAIGKTVDWLKSLDSGTNEIIVSVGILAGAIGPLLIGMGGILKLVPLLIAGFGALTGPIALTVAAIAGAAALIYTNWDTLAAYFTTGDGAEMWQTTKRIVTTTMGAVKLAIKTAVTEIKRIWGSIAAYFTTGDGAEFWSSLVETVSTYMKAVWSTIKFYIGVIKALWDTFGDRIISRLSSAWDRIKIITSTVFRVLIDIVTTALDQITNFINLFKGIFTGDWQLIWDSVKNIVITSVNGTISVIESLVTGSMDLLISFLDSLGVGDAIKESLKAGRDSISKFAESLKISKQGIDKNTEAAEAWGAAVKAAGDKAEEAGKKAANAAYGGGKGSASGGSEINIGRADTSGIVVPDISSGTENYIANLQSMKAATGEYRNVTDAALGRTKEEWRIFNENMQQVTDQTNQIINQFFVNTISSFANGLAEMASGAKTFGDMVSGLVSQLSNLMIEIGTLWVSFGTGFAAAMNPATLFASGGTSAIAAGAGLIAAGIALKGLLNSFHEGGIVPGGGDVPIMAKGGEGVFTKGQMAAMGNLQPRQSSSGLSESSLQYAFERALSNKMSRLGPKEVFVLSQQGKRGF